MCAEVSSGHFGTGAEVSWYRSVLGPKCPVTVIFSLYYICFGFLSVCLLLDDNTHNFNRLKTQVFATSASYVIMCYIKDVER